jgi:hypothetical protein
MTLRKFVYLALYKYLHKDKDTMAAYMVDIHVCTGGVKILQFELF